MSGEQITYKPGSGVPIPLAELVKPWIGATVIVQFKDGQKVRARIDSLDEATNMANLTVIPHVLLEGQ